MQTAGNLIGVFIEFTSGMQNRHHNFKSALVLFRHNVNRDSASIILNCTGSVLVQCDRDVFTESGKSFINGVVHNLIDKMVQTTGIGTADIHGRALTHRSKTLENGDVRRIVIVGH